MGLDCVVYIYAALSIVNTTVLHNSWLAESSDVETCIEGNPVCRELWIQPDYELYRFCAEGSVPLSISILYVIYSALSLLIVQGVSIESVLLANAPD